jgi:hypothetical protein
MTATPIGLAFTSLMSRTEDDRTSAIGDTDMIPPGAREKTYMVRVRDRDDQEKNARET